MNYIDSTKIQELYPIGTIILYTGWIGVVTGYTKDGKKLRMNRHTVCQLHHHPVFYVSQHETPSRVIDYCKDNNITPIFMVNYIGPKV